MKVVIRFLRQLRVSKSTYDVVRTGVGVASYDKTMKYCVTV